MPPSLRRSAAEQPLSRGLRGFTLVELLVVVAIILILIGLLVPAVNQVRKQAKVASSQAMFNGIETGLAAYKADSNVGGGFPPSRSDHPSAMLVFNPHAGRPLKDELHREGGLSGASLLLWGLAGADLLGTPGFFDLDGDGVWWRDTLGGQGTSPDGLYRVDPNTLNPIHTRYGPFVDLEKIRVTPKVAGQNYFKVPTGPGQEVGTPVFLDTFGSPILYYRADPSATQMVFDQNAPAEPGIFRQEDNRCYTGQGAGGNYLGIDLGGGKDHKIKQALPPGGLPNPPQPSNWNLPDDKSTFAYYINDLNVTVNLQPKNRQSYLLISAGPDLLYGTGDDITNFEKNK